jgi:hypothetical protein
MTTMSDILSAASLLLAVATVLYALWYPEILASININIPPYKEDRSGPLSDLKNTLYSRAIPLFIMTLLVAGVFIPDALKIISETIGYLRQDRPDVVLTYSSVKTAFVFVVILSIALVFQTGGMLRKLLSHKNEMENKF